MAMMNDATAAMRTNVRAKAGEAISGDDAGKVADLSDSLVLSGVLLGAALPLVTALVGVP